MYGPHGGVPMTETMPMRGKGLRSSTRVTKAHCPRLSASYFGRLAAKRLTRLNGIGIMPGSENAMRLA
jgi:hypothetical protein